MHAGLPIMSSIPVTPPAPTAGSPASVGAEKATAGLTGFADKLITAVTAMQPAGTVLPQPATLPAISSGVRSDLRPLVTILTAPSQLAAAPTVPMPDHAVAPDARFRATTLAAKDQSTASLQQPVTAPVVANTPTAAAVAPDARLRAITLAAKDQSTATLQQPATVPVVANTPTAAAVAPDARLRATTLAAKDQSTATLQQPVTVPLSQMHRRPHRLPRLCQHCLDLRRCRRRRKRRFHCWMPQLSLRHRPRRRRSEMANPSNPLTAHGRHKQCDARPRRRPHRYRQRRHR